MTKRAIVNYDVSYRSENGEIGTYSNTKWMFCDENGKVTKEVCLEWENKLVEMETINLEKNNPIKISHLSIAITSFTKFDV